jgi:hypothetical protein
MYQCTYVEYLAAQIRKTMEKIIALETHKTAPEAAEYLDTKLGNARKEKDALIEEYAQHLKMHGCDERRRDLPGLSQHLDHDAAHD